MRVAGSPISCLPHQPGDEGLTKPPRHCPGPPYPVLLPGEQGGAEWHWVATELDPGSVEYARGNVARNGWGDRIQATICPHRSEGARERGSEGARE